MSESLKNEPLLNLTRFSDDVVFGDAWYEPGGECGPRIQPNYELIVILFGHADLILAEKKYPIPPGSAALTQPGTREHFFYSPVYRTHHTWCAVHPHAVPLILKKRLEGVPFVHVQSEIFELLMKAAFSIPNWRKEEGRDLMNNLGVDLLYEYARMVSDSGKIARESPCDLARQYLEKHCEDEDCLKGASRAAGITPEHLIRLFRQQYHVTPGRYLWQARVERGVALLTATGLTVSQIAHRCGFKNPYHFSRLLRATQGVSPRQLRERSWKSIEKGAI
jgi:AraC-like DNA-binding protein